MEIYPKKLIWNYLGREEECYKCFFPTQNDWNGTLLSKINHMRAIRYQTIPFDRGSNEIKSPEKYRKIFETMEFYDREKEMFSNGVKLNFTLSNRKSHLLIGDEHKIMIKNF